MYCYTLNSEEEISSDDYKSEYDNTSGITEEGMNQGTKQAETDSKQGNGLTSE